MIRRAYREIKGVASLSRPLMQEDLGVLEVGRVKSLGEPVVHPCQQVPTKHPRVMGVE
jgi:hypothetical protein